MCSDQVHSFSCLRMVLSTTPMVVDTGSDSNLVCSTDLTYVAVVILSASIAMAHFLMTPVCLLVLIYMIVTMYLRMYVDVIGYNAVRNFETTMMHN